MTFACSVGPATSIIGILLSDRFLVHSLLEDAELVFLSLLGATAGSLFLDLSLGPQVEQRVSDDLLVEFLELKELLGVLVAWRLFLEAAWLVEEPRRPV